MGISDYYRLLHIRVEFWIDSERVGEKKNSWERGQTARNKMQKNCKGRITHQILRASTNGETIEHKKLIGSSRLRNYYFYLRFETLIWIDVDREQLLSDLVFSIQESLASITLNGCSTR